MTEPIAAASFRARAAEDVFDWLLRDTYAERYIDNLLVALGVRLRNAGLSVARISLQLRTGNREWLGASVLWRAGHDEAEIALRGYETVEADTYLNSPIRAIREGQPEVRRRLWQLGPDNFDYPILQELQEEGCTDYVAWPVFQTLDKMHVVTFASDGKTGFGDDEIAFLRRLVQLLALVVEVRVKNILTRSFLETYVGPLATGRILNGDTRRGFGSSIDAATMVCDLRNFTDISSSWPRDRIIGLLDDYFDAIAEPIERNGGEILKFMGDGLLAIFPLEEPEACRNLLHAVREGQKALEVLNVENSAKGLPVLRQGIGVHVGEVSYGNIGSRHRLDFTVIGPVVNIAARLQDMTKESGHSVLISGDFAARSGAGEELEKLGAFPVRGIPEAIDVYALKPL